MRNLYERPALAITLVLVLYVATEAAVHGVLFFGVLPAGMAMLWVRMLSRRWHRPDVPGAPAPAAGPPAPHGISP